MKEVRSTLTDEEYAEVMAYVAKKRRWRRVSHFVRDAIFQTMERYPASKSIGGTARGPGGQ